MAVGRGRCLGEGDEGERGRESETESHRLTERLRFRHRHRDSETERQTQPERQAKRHQHPGRLTRLRPRGRQPLVADTIQTRAVHKEEQTCWACRAGRRRSRSLLRREGACHKTQRTVSTNVPCQREALVAWLARFPHIIHICDHRMDPNPFGAKRGTNLLGMPSRSMTKSLLAPARRCLPRDTQTTVSTNVPCASKP